MTKKEDDLRKELDEMRAQILALSAAKEAEAAAADPSEAEISAAAVAAAAAAAVEEHRPADFEGLMDELRREVEELPVMTTLAVFALGVMVGRLMAH